MIELPEAIVLANQLKKEILNREIINVCAKQSPHKFTFFNDDYDYEKELLNKKIKDVTSTGPIVEIVFEDALMTFRDGTNLRFITDKAKLPKKHQLLLEFDNDTYLVITVQMYGEIHYTKDSREGEYYYQITKLNSNPSKDDFSQEYFLNMLNNCDEKISIKAALATEQRIPGIGNGVLQDILFNAKLNPKTKLKDISDKEKKELYKVIMDLINEMIVKGGRDTEKDIYGNPGNYQTILSSKNYKNGCPICHGEIIKQNYLGGSIYFCPKEQPIIK